MLFAAACTFGAGSTSQTASVSPQTSPSSTTANPGQATPVASSPTAQPTTSTGSLAITSMPVHNGEVGVIYLAVNFVAAGGTAPYAWTVDSGNVPPGLALSPDGTFTGNDTKAGSFAFTVKVTDSAGQVAAGNITMTVFPALAVSQPCANVCYVGIGCTTCGRFGTVSGGAGPYTYKIIGGAVPDGMAWNNAFGVNGAWPTPVAVINPNPVLVEGPPPIFRALWNLSVTVTDDFGVSKTVKANWIEFGPNRFSNSNAFCETSPCVDSSISYTGGSLADNFSVFVVKACFNDPNQNFAYVCSPDASQTAAYLPPGWSATAKGGRVTVHFDCGAACNQFTGDVFIVLIDHGACVAPAYVQSLNEADVNIDWVP